MGRGRAALVRVLQSYQGYVTNTGCHHLHSIRRRDRAPLADRSVGLSIFMANPDESGLPVLIVDDDPFIRDFLSDVLEDAGYPVLTAADGRAALQVLRRQPVALVVTDLMMPYVNGLDLFRQLRAEPATAELPIIAMSAAFAGAGQVPFTTFLPKPFEIASLLAVVQRYYSAGQQPPAQEEGEREA